MDFAAKFVLRPIRYEILASASSFKNPCATSKIVSISLLLRSLIETMWRVSGWVLVIKTLL